MEDRLELANIECKLYLKGKLLASAVGNTTTIAKRLACIAAMEALAQPTTRKRKQEE
jgi:hypothetical protein